jgi:hypothetical protein
MSEGGEGVIFDFRREGVWIFSGMTHFENCADKQFFSSGPRTKNNKK